MRVTFVCRPEDTTVTTELEPGEMPSLHETVEFDGEDGDGAPSGVYVVAGVRRHFYGLGGRVTATVALFPRRPTRRDLEP